MILYGHAGCPGTERARRYLRSHGISFSDRDVSQPRWANELACLGLLATPVLLVGSRRMVGFDEAAFGHLWASPPARGGDAGGRNRSCGEGRRAIEIDGDKLWYLSKINLFADLDQGTLRQLAQVVPMVEVPRGTVVTSPSESGRVLYLLKRGRVRLYKITPGGREVTLAVLGDGNVFGATGTIGLGSRDMYAETIDGCLLCAMAEADVSALIQRHPQVGLRLIGVLTERVQQLEELVESLSHQSVRDRILRLLLHLSKDFGIPEGGFTRIDVPLTHEDIATMVGSTRETVTATLSELGRVGVVKKGRRSLAVAAAACEAKLAEGGDG